MLRLIQILFLVLPLCTFSQVHFFHADIDVTSVGKKISLKSVPGFTSKISHSEISSINNIDNNIVLYEGEILEDFSIEFSVDPNASNNLAIGLYEQTSTSNINYAFLFNGNEVSIKGPSYDLPLSGYYFSGDVFKVVKCGPLVLFYRNNVLIVKRSILNSYNSFNGILNLQDADMTEVFIMFDVLSECEAFDEKVYVMPQSKVIGDLHVIDDSSLNVYFLSKYIPNIGGSTNWYIYDNSNSPILTGVSTNKYGSNYLNIDLSGQAPGVYLFSIEGQNKKEKKYIKFKIE